MAKRIAKKKARSKAGKGANPDRTPDGKFKPGHSIKSPGNPHYLRITEYNQAIQDAITPGALNALMRRLVRFASEGDMAAAKLVLDRTLGKATAARPRFDVGDLGVESLASIEDVTRTSQEIVRAIVEGRMSPDDGVKLASIVELTRRSIETHELAERIGLLENEVGEGHP